MENHLAWIQAALQVRFGGLGLRCAVHLSPSAYLVPPDSSTNLIHQILLPCFQEATIPMKEEALAVWANGNYGAPQRTQLPTKKDHGLSVVSKPQSRLCWIIP